MKHGANSQLPQLIQQDGVCVLSTVYAIHSLVLLLLALIVSIANCGCSRQTSSPSPIKSVRSLDELRKLPVGLKVSNNPNPVYAVRGGRSGMDFTWSFETTVSSLEQDLTIVEFGCYVEHKGNWEFSTMTGKPFTKADFAEWYSCPDAVLRRGMEVSDPHNWAGGDELRGSRTIWYFIGEDNEGNRFYGEAEIEEVGELERSP